MSNGFGSRDDGLWELLLDRIADRSIIPIVGRDLLTVTVDGEPTTLYAAAAPRLASALDVPDTIVANAPLNPLSAVAAYHILKGGASRPIYEELARIMNELGELSIPDSLGKLAAIDGFSLFVTTTFDNLLTRAVAAGRQTDPRVLAFSTRAQAANRDITSADELAVYHMFGRLSVVPDCVITEEDALEVVFSTLDEKYRPTRLLLELSQRSLLIVGCSFPSWAVRFFLRLARGKRLLHADQNHVAFVVDPGASQDGGLLQFFQTFKTGTEVFSQHDAVGFVDELSRRWHERSPMRPPAETIPAFAVFVSYASEDRARVEPIVSSLQASGLPVWFDRDAIQPGDRWSDNIARGIDAASAFVPILSNTAVAATDRYYIREWRRSLERNRGIAFDDRFLFPIAIDDVDRNSPAIPDEFQAVQWTRVNDAVPLELVTRLNEAIRRKKSGARR